MILISFLTTYYCKLIEGTPKLTDHIAIKLLLLDELSSLDQAPATIPAIEKILNQLS